MQEANLHQGILLDQNRKKFWIDEKTGHNCFMLLPRDLTIVWGDDERYWKWNKGSETCLCDGNYSNHDLAELVKVCWLEVTGKKKTSNLSAGVTYKVALQVYMTGQAYGWDVASVILKLKTPSGKVQQSQVSLRDKPRNQSFQLDFGEFSRPNGNEGEIEFSLLEIEGKEWKSGLIIKGVVIEPSD